MPALFTLSTGTTDGTAGSLRSAIIAANSNGQDDVIQLQAGLYQLTLANVANKQENAAATGDLDVTEAGHSLTIQGVDASATFIDAHSIDRAFQVFPNATLILKDLTVTGGVAGDDGTKDAVAFTSTDAHGGGILNDGGSVTLDHVRLENNAAYGLILGNPPPGTPGTNALGGGVYSDGTLTVLDSVVADNTTFAGTGAAGVGVGVGAPGKPGLAGGFANGGGLYIKAGKATLNDSTLSGNMARGGFGGHGSAGGDSFFNGPVWAGGTGGSGGTGAGGGLYVDGGEVTLAGSAVTGNSAPGGQGGQAGRGRAFPS